MTLPGSTSALATTASPRDALWWCVRWVLGGPGQVWRDAAEVEEEPRRSVAQRECRQGRVGHCGAVAPGAAAKELCRDLASHRRRNPKPDKDDEARESIRDQEG